jgi:hypothetical protein
MLEQEGTLVWLPDSALGWIGGTVVLAGSAKNNTLGAHGASDIRVRDDRGRVSVVRRGRLRA